VGFIAYEDSIASRYSDDKSDESHITGIDSTYNNNTITYSIPLPFTFDVRKQFTFIDEYFGWCTGVVSGGNPRFA
jgi:hypothetical protein